MHTHIYVCISSCVKSWRYSAQLIIAGQFGTSAEVHPHHHHCVLAASRHGRKVYGEENENRLCSRLLLAAYNVIDVWSSRGFGFAALWWVWFMFGHSCLPLVAGTGNSWVSSHSLQWYPLCLPWALILVAAPASISLAEKQLSAW